MSKIISPKYNTLVRVGSIFINLHDTLNREEQIKNICDYIFSKLYDMYLDVICIQGITETKLAKYLVKNIKELAEQKLLAFDIAPTIEIKNNSDEDNSLSLTWNSSSKSEEKSEDINEIIISRFPIFSYSVHDLYNSIDSKLIGNKKLLIANINIDGYIVSFANISLIPDFIGVNNSRFRKKEITKISALIKNNNENISNFIKDNPLKFIHKKITLLCGIFNIPERKNDIVNTEMIQTLRDLDSIDIFRLITTIKKENNSGYTNMYDIRDCYICMNIHNHTNDKEYNNTDEITKKIFSQYGITFINSYVVKYHKISDYFPVEIIFLLNKKEKKFIQN